MTEFNPHAPGVEWSQDGLDNTVPLLPALPDRDPYPSCCPACGGEIGLDGYCQQCGQKARSLREHYEVNPVPWVAGVCDIGLSHIRNEDALACQADENRAVIVVCDGVTTSEDSDVASMAAAQAACLMLWTNDPRGLGTPASRNAAIQALMTQAVAAANHAVVDSTDPASQNSAATTIALTVVDAEAIHCANLGDSRVYWFPDHGEPVQLTRDHSLAQAGIDSGTGRAEAESSVFAHTITKWLGRDAVDVVPYVAVVPLESPGWLIACTDGLWNYASEAADLAQLVDPIYVEDPTPLHLASQLVDWANEQGGHDNITVACARVDFLGQGSSPSSPDIAQTTGADAPGSH